MNISNIDEATAAEIQKYMKDHGVVDLRLRRERYSNTASGWRLSAVLADKTQISGGPFHELGAAMRFLVHKLEEA